MKKKSITKNYFYNMIYQLFLIIVPIAVTPYVARVLGDDASGRYSFATSILTYFTLFAALGFGYYAQREIAKHQDNQEMQAKIFWEIIIARFIPVIITTVVYIGILLSGVYGDKYTVLIAILIIQVVAIAFDIAFLFQGNEDFAKIVIRNVIIKSLSIASIFIFIKEPNDLWKYVLIQSLTVILSNISLWLGLSKKIFNVDLKKLRPLKHLLPTLILFLPTIATSIYTSLDKTLIGVITGIDSENGNYEYAEKLVKMLLTIVTSLGVVVIPRNSKYFADGNIEAVKENIYKSIQFVLCLGIPLMLGTICIADNLIPWYLGDGYNKAANLMKILSPIILIIGLSNVFGLQFLIPSGQDKKFTISIITGAVINFGLNWLLITYWKSYGAAVATVVAEFFVTLFMIVFARKDIKFYKAMLSSWKYVVSGLIMFLPCYFVGNILNPSIFNTLIIVVIGVVVYGMCLVILRDKFVFGIISKVKLKFHKKDKKEDGTMKYDYLIVGSGLYGAVIAHEAKKAGKSVLVVEKRSHIGGNVYTENIEGINVHKYGAHIFHTNNKEIWQYINQFAEFNRYTNSPIANYKGEIYSLPFNMYTFNQIWGVVTPQEAKNIIEQQKSEAGISNPQNLEEQAISLVGKDIYEKLIKGYTQKQWGRPCSELPSFIIKRLPVRFSFDNNYFNALYQGVPIGGYTKMVENMLDGIEIRLNCDYLTNKEELNSIADKIIYTGPIDAYFDFKFGELEYRSVRFETQILDMENYQGNAVVNYTDIDTAYTRIIEHKFFEFGTQPKTVISKEYSSEWEKSGDPYYPINNHHNDELYAKYKELADNENNIIFGGRLGEYKYYDMDVVIEAALKIAEKLLNEN